MNKRLITTAILAALAAVPVTQASAATTNTASALLDWSRFSIDFLTGSGSFAAGSSQTSAVAYWWSGSTEAYRYDATSSSAATGGVSATGLANGTTLGATAVATNGPDGLGNGAASGFANVWGLVTLNPYSSVEFSVPYTLSASIGNLGVKDASNASVQFNVYTSPDAPYRVWSDYAEISISGSTPASSSSDWLDVIVKNRTGAPETLNWFAQASADTHVTEVPAIPEPETYAMMIAGLGLVTVMARRRR